MAIKATKETIPLDYLESKIKDMMLMEFEKYKTTIPWDGMLNECSKRMLKMIKEEIVNA
tara:strand:+ start:1734 stop:1910 length:177 start_codon:yes stop_codon:yes gene_type:complete